MGEITLREKSYQLAIQVVKLYHLLLLVKIECILPEANFMSRNFDLSKC